MSASQHHGFAIEQRLIAEFPRRNPALVRPPSNLAQDYTARFDVPAEHDPFNRGIPTSIKSARFRGPRTLVCLADAVRTVSLAQEERMRLMVALYRQDGDEKVVEELREYEILGEEWATMCGNVPRKQIETFAAALKGGTPTEARAQAKQWQQRLAQAHPSLMRWNPKIDSQRQRRLQCSISLFDIESVIEDRSRIRVYGQAMGDGPRPGYLKSQSERLWGRGLHFPFHVDSAVRARHAPADPATEPLPPVGPAEPATDPTARVPSPRSRVRMRA
jgi:hypothetical protein